MQSQKARNGFTIVEILIVIVVIAILAAITVVAYNGIQGRARDTKRLSDVAQIQKALEVYKIEFGNYPAQVGTTGFYGWEVSTSGSFLQSIIDAGVVPSIPVDPSNIGDSSNFGRAGSSWIYMYAVYGSGQNGCDPLGGAYYILTITRMDTVESGQNYPSSPGFSCGDRNWASDGAWVTGAYENG